jgi:hypothetical protein
MFRDELLLQYIDGGAWKLVAAFGYCTDDGTEIRVPTGFVTDFASIPRALWSLLPPTGRYGKAAAIHDWLYSHRVVDDVITPAMFTRGSRLVNRAEADRIFREAMRTLGVSAEMAWTLYAGVRVGGWKPWRAYRAQEQYLDWVEHRIS